MRAGLLRERITLLKKLSIQDQRTGEMIETYQSFKTVYAAITYLSGHALIAAQAAHSAISAEIVIRYIKEVDGITKIHHLKDGIKNYFQIEAILPDRHSGREYLKLLVKKDLTHVTENNI